MTGTLHEDRYTFFISRSFLLILRKVSDKDYKENRSTRLIFKNLFFFENFEIMWKNMEQPDRPKTTILRMRIACTTPNTTNANSEYVLFIAFPPYQWLHERASVSRDTYIACLVHCWLQI